MNKRFPKKGDTVKIVNCKLADKYKDRELTVKRAPFVFDRQIVVQIEGIRVYFPIKNLEIIESV